MEQLRQIIRDVPDFPQKGIVFKDITPLLGDAPSFKKAIHYMAEPLKSREFDALIGIESRGFIFAAALRIRAGQRPNSRPQAGEAPRGNRAGFLRARIWN